MWWYKEMFLLFRKWLLKLIAENKGGQIQAILDSGNTQNLTRDSWLIILWGLLFLCLLHSSSIISQDHHPPEDCPQGVTKLQMAWEPCPQGLLCVSLSLAKTWGTTNRYGKETSRYVSYPGPLKARKISSWRERVCVKVNQCLHVFSEITNNIQILCMHQHLLWKRGTHPSFCFFKIFD